MSFTKMYVFYVERLIKISDPMERTSVNAHGPNKLNTSCYQLYYMLGPTLNTEKIHKSRLSRG